MLIVLACAAAGWEAAARLRRQISLLDELCGLLAGMERELAQRGTPLPQLLLDCGKQLRHSGELHRIADALRAGNTADRAAEVALQRLSSGMALPQAADTLRRLCRVLGRYDGTTQAEACSEAAAQLMLQQEALQHTLDERGRLYRVLPPALGAIAALVIF